MSSASANDIKTFLTNFLCPRIIYEKPGGKKTQDLIEIVSSQCDVFLSPDPLS